jgi:hypothetical protein
VRLIAALLLLSPAVWRRWVDLCLEHLPTSPPLALLEQSDEIGTWGCPHDVTRALRRARDDLLWGLVDAGMAGRIRTKGLYHDREVEMTPSRWTILSTAAKRPFHALHQTIQISQDWLVYDISQSDPYLKGAGVELLPAVVPVMVFNEHLGEAAQAAANNNNRISPAATSFVTAASAETAGTVRSQASHEAVPPTEAQEEAFIQELAGYLDSLGPLKRPKLHKLADAHFADDERVHWIMSKRKDKITGVTEYTIKRDLYFRPAMARRKSENKRSRGNPG